MLPTEALIRVNIYKKTDYLLLKTKISYYLCKNCRDCLLITQVSQVADLLTCSLARRLMLSS